MTGILGYIDSQPIEISRNPGYNWPMAGTTIYGLVTDQSNEGTRVDIEGHRIFVPVDIGIVEQPGQTAAFEVIRSGSIPQFKYLRPDNGVRSFSHGQTIKTTTVIKDYRELISSCIKDWNTAEQSQIETLIKETQATVSSLSENLEDGDLRQMILDGFDPMKEGLKVVAQVLKSNKPLVMYHRMSDLSGEVHRAVHQLSGHYKDREFLKETASALKMAGLSVNRKHVDSIHNALGALKVVSDSSSDKAGDLLYQLQKHQSPSLAEAYKLCQSAGKSHQASIVTGEKITAAVRRFLQDAGIEITEENMDAAKLLVSKQVAVTDGAIDFVKNPAQVLSGTDRQAYISMMTQKLAAGESPASVIIPELADLLKTEDGSLLTEAAQTDDPAMNQQQLQDLERIVNQVKAMRISHMAKAVLTGRYKTLAEAITVLDDNQAALTNPTTNSQSPTADIIDTALTFKRQMSEIQLKMTLEVAVRLENQGISVATASIETVVQRLASEELATAAVQVKSYSSIDQVDRNLEMVAAVRDTFDAVVNLQGSRQDVLVAMMKDTGRLTMDRISRMSDNLEEQTMRTAVLQLQRATEGYNDGMTVIRQDLGDRIEQTFDQILPMLGELGLFDTEANRTAAQALARNNMAINETNILEIQVLQEKIDRITTILTPATVVKMIQAGIQPAAMDIDELLSVTQALEAAAPETKISELIYGLDTKNALDSKQRKALIAIYRMLDTVVRSEGAATGFLVKNNLQLTVGSLFEAAKFIRRTRQAPSSISVDIDDGFGMLEELANKEEMINRQTAAGGDDSAAALRRELMDLRIMSFIQVLKGDETTVLVGEQESRMTKIPLEELTQLIRSQVALNETEGDAAAYLNVLNEKPELIRTMINNGIPMTFENFSKAVAMDKNLFLLMDDLSTLVENMDDALLKEEVVNRLTQASEKVLNGEVPYESLKIALEEVEDLLRYAEDTQSPEAFKATLNAKATLNQVQMMQISEDYYQIPVYIQQQLTQLNIYILNQSKLDRDDGNDMKVLMSFEAGTMGKVQALITLVGDCAAMEIQSTYPEDRSVLKQHEQAFRAVLERTDFKLLAITYGPFDTKEPVAAGIGPEDMKMSQKTHDGHIDRLV